MGSTRNVYEDGIDFAALALQSSDFAKQLSRASEVDLNKEKDIITDIISVHTQCEEQIPTRFQ